ncbi:MAG: glycosyltransferase family 2 protein [Acutalibacteraceae bacterium]
MNNESLISVIVPIYKVEKYLKRCVDSILNQTYKNLEIILVDDGSPDNCPRMCDEYAEKDDRIKVIHKENGGLSDARNKGIDIANGEYLAFIDSDDFVSEDYIEKLYDAILKGDADLSMCSFIYVDEQGAILSDKRNHNPMVDTVLCAKEVLEYFYRENGWYYVVAWNKLYKKELFNDVRFPYGKVHEDQYVFHHIISKCSRVSVISSRLVYYSQRQDSIMGTLNSKTIPDDMGWRYERFMFFRHKGWEELEKLAALDYFYAGYNVLSRIWKSFEKQERLCAKALLKQMKEVYLWLKMNNELKEFSNLGFNLLKHNYRLYFLLITLKRRVKGKSKG